jgi:hypothetical protein
MEFVIPTTRSNYLMNAISSAVIAILGVFLFTVGHDGVLLKLAVFLCVFFVSYRLGEYMLTGKILVGHEGVWGPVHEGKTAREIFKWGLLICASIVLLMIIVILSAKVERLLS